MSRSDFGARKLPAAVKVRKGNCVMAHAILMKKFEDTHDFPLNYRKPDIDNSPDCNEPPRIYPRPWRGSKRAYLRRRARGAL